LAKHSRATEIDRSSCNNISQIQQGKAKGRRANQAVTARIRASAGMKT
jgi:hypothetical protein